MDIIISLILTAVAVLITTYILPGVVVTGFIDAFLVAIVISVINTFIKPVIILLTLPINILTIGLFTFVINALIIMFVSYLIPGFKVDGFWWALLFSIILSLVNSIIFSLVK
ncbi:MAG: phage holin family protein [Candidatus Gracilibacteria bacterium]